MPTDELRCPKPKKEFRCMQILKKDLEQAYKEYVQIVFTFNKEGDMDQIQKFERKLNSLREKAADLLDMLDEIVRKEEVK